MLTIFNMRVYFLFIYVGLHHMHNIIEGFCLIVSFSFFNLFFLFSELKMEVNCAIFKLSHSIKCF